MTMCSKCGEDIEHVPVKDGEVQNVWASEGTEDWIWTCACTAQGDVEDQDRYYHASQYDLEPGTVLKPASQRDTTTQNHLYPSDQEWRRKHVWMTDSVDSAKAFAGPHIYEVKPLGPVKEHPVPRLEDAEDCPECAGDGEAWGGGACEECGGTGKDEHYDPWHHQQYHTTHAEIVKERP